jgi:hypothetical protein
MAEMNIVTIGKVVDMTEAFTEEVLESPSTKSVWFSINPKTAPTNKMSRSFLATFSGFMKRLITQKAVAPAKNRNAFKPMGLTTPFIKSLETTMLRPKKTLAANKARWPGYFLLVFISFY